MAPSRYGLMPKGMPGFGPRAVTPTTDMIYMRPQWKAVKPYQPGLRPKTPEFRSEAVKSTSAMVYKRPQWKAGNQYQPRLCLKRTSGCGTRVEVKPKPNMVQTHTLLKAKKPALIGPGLRTNIMFGYGKAVGVKPKSDMVQTHTQQKATKPSGPRLSPNRMPVCGKAVPVQPKSTMVQTHTRPSAVQPALSGPGLCPNRMPVCVKAVAVKPTSSMVQKHTRQKAAKQAPSGHGLGTNGTPGTGRTKKAVKQRSSFVQSYIPLPLVTPSFLETVQELWYLRALKPIRRGKRQKRVAEKRMRIFISDPSVDSELVSIYQCSPKEWKLMNWNFKFVNKKRQQKKDIHAKGDPGVYVWMVLWSTGQQKIMDTDNVHELLKAAIFLKGRILIQNCLAFFREHKLDLATLQRRFLEQLAPYLTNMDIERLGYLKNYKSNLIRHLYFKLTCALMRQADPHRGHFVNTTLLFKCGFCKKLVPKELEDRIPCVSLADRKTLGTQGLLRRKYSEHRADHSWSVERYSRQLLGQVDYWRNVYWLLWSETHYLDCANCNLTFPVQDMFTCHLNAQHEPSVRNLAEHAIYTTFRKNFRLIIYLYQLKQGKSKKEHTADDKVQVRPIMDLPKLGLRIPYGRKSAYMGHRYIGKGHSWQYNKTLVVNKLNQIRYETSIHGRIRHFLRKISVQRKYKKHTQNKSKLKRTRHTERRRWVSIHYQPQGGVYSDLLHKWQQMLIKNQKPIVKIVRPKLTFSAPPTSFDIRHTYTGNENCPETAASRPQTRRPNTRAAKRPDTCTPTRPNTRAPKHPKKRTAAPTNISEAVSCNAGLWKHRVEYDAWEGDTIPLLRPCNRRPKTKAKNCPNLGADQNPTASSAMRTCTQRRTTKATERPHLGDKENPTPSSEALPCPQRMKAKVSKNRNLGADENPIARLATRTCTQRQTTKVTERPHLGEEENLTPSSEALPCPQSMKAKVSKNRNLGADENPIARLAMRTCTQRQTTKVTERPHLGEEENPTPISEDFPCPQRMKAKVSKNRNVRADENPTSSSAMRTCNQRRTTNGTEHPHLGEEENPTPSSEALPCPQRMKTKVSKDRNLGAGEHRSRMSATQLPNTTVTNRRNLGAGKILTSEMQPCNLSPRTRLTEHPTLDPGGLKSRILAAQSLKTRVTLYPSLGVGENPTSSSAVHACTEHPKIRSTKDLNLGSSEHSSTPLTRHPTTMVIKCPNLGTDEHSRKALCRYPITLVTKRPNLGSGEHLSKTLSQHPIKKEMESPRSGAGELLTAVSSAHPCICRHMSAEK